MIEPAEHAAQIAEVRRLFRQYEESLGVDLCFQDFERELAELPGRYAPPDGALLIAVEGGRTVGCVALRKLDEGICEMKRLFVQPAYRGRGIGRALAEAIIRQAVRLGYRRMRLDTLDKLREATGLYESLGFRRIEPYCHNPLCGAAFWELELTASTRSG